MKLHPELLPKKFRGKQKTATTIKEDLGSNLEDESRIVAMGIKGTLFVNSNSSIQSKLKCDVKEKKRNELFHIRVIVNHKNIDTLFDNES